ncbi:MAG TPA: YraN family protein [Thermoanaerobaculia bacterium]
MRIGSKRLGFLGELLAALLYLMRGYRLVARNLRLPAGEIDLVARRGGITAIVEVKTRQSLTAGEGHDAVDRRKRERLVRLGDQYLARAPNARLRYDIVSLYWTGCWFQVTWLPDAFRPESEYGRPWRWRV